MDRIARDLFVRLGGERANQPKRGAYLVLRNLHRNDPMNTAFRQMMGVFAEGKLEKSHDYLENGRSRDSEGQEGAVTLRGAPQHGIRPNVAKKVLRKTLKARGLWPKYLRLRSRTPGFNPPNQIADI